MKSRKIYGINVGTSSILVIIVVLSLICFAGLSIISATADYKLSKKLAERTTAYYKAASLANERFANWDRTFPDIYRESSSEEEYLQKIKESFADSLTFSYAISETQSLFVSVEPLYPETEDGNFFRTSRFQIMSTQELALDNSLPVLLGD